MFLPCSIVQYHFASDLTRDFVFLGHSVFNIVLPLLVIDRLDGNASYNSSFDKCILFVIIVAYCCCCLAFHIIRRFVGDGSFLYTTRISCNLYSFRIIVVVVIILFFRTVWISSGDGRYLIMLMVASTN